MSSKGYDPIKPWFLAAESLGEFIGMRFARIPPGATEPDWIYVRHCDYDGVGAIKMMFGERGGEVGELPQARHPARPSFRSLFKLVKKQMQPRAPHLHWKDLGPKGDCDPGHPPPAAAWHVFNEAETLRIRKFSSASGVTVNSFLLEQLTEIIRPYLREGKSATIPWMIPVNLRGRVTSSGELANHTSFLGVTVKPADTLREIHQSTQEAMEREEPCTNWFAYGLGRYLPQGIRKFLVARGLATSWNLGAFSNLGAWDSEKKITSPDCLGDWLVAPPVLRVQLIGAGCITFQNRLSLLIQAHPELTTDAAVCRKWIQEWVAAIETELAKPDASCVSATLRA